MNRQDFFDTLTEQQREDFETWEAEQKQQYEKERQRDKKRIEELETGYNDLNAAYNKLKRQVKP